MELRISVLRGALALASFTLASTSASAQWFDISGPNPVNGTAIAANATGQTFIGGTFIGSVDISPALTLVNGGNLEGYLAMIDGGIAWAITVPSAAGTVVVNEVAPMSDGGVVVVGSFSTDLVPGGLVATGSSDGYVVRYDATGTALWAAHIAGNAYDTARGVAVDDGDNIFVTGYFYESPGGTNVYDSNGMLVETFISTGANDAYVAAFDDNGLYLWSDVMGGTGFDEGYDVAVDAFGDVFVTGSFSDVATVASVALASTGSHDLYVGKYDNSGAPEWAVSGGGDGLDEGRGITATGTGDVVVTGFITESAIFSGIGLSSSGVGDEEIVVARYDSAGVIQWASTSGGSADDRGFAVAERLNGSLVVAAYNDGGFGDIAVLFDSAGAYLNGWGPGVFAIGDDVTVSPISGQLRLTGDQTGQDAFVVAN